MRVQLEDLRSVATPCIARLSPDMEDEAPMLARGRVYLVSDRVLEGIEAESEADDAIDVQPGDVILLSDTGEDRVFHHLTMEQAFGEDDASQSIKDFLIRDPRVASYQEGVIPVLGNIPCTREILSFSQGSEFFAAPHRRLLDSINEYMTTIGRIVDTDPERVPSRVRASVHAISLLDANPDAEFQVTAQDLSKYFDAKVLRERIREMSRDAGVPISDNLVGRRESPDLPRPDGSILTTGAQARQRLASLAQDPATNSMAAAFDGLQHGVFDRITSLNIDDMTVAAFKKGQVADFKADLQRGGGVELEGEWPAAMSQGVRDVLGEAMPGYTFESHMFTKDGFDILVIEDFSGGYAYTWPSHDRVPVFECTNGDRPVSSITPDMIPDDEELAALQSTAQEIYERVLGRDGIGGPGA